MNKYKPKFCESMFMSSLVEIMAEDYKEAKYGWDYEEANTFSNSFLHMLISIYLNESVFIFLFVFK